MEFGTLASVRNGTSMISAVALGAAACMVAAGTAFAAKPAPLIVGNPLTCPHATYTTINAAVAAASAGDTIKVCAGNYPEQVNVNKELTFLGAQSGKDGRKGRNNPAKESVVANPSGADFALMSAADNVTIDGFTLSGIDSNSTNYGISAFQGTSGLVVTNNVITGNCEGINFQNPNASMPSVIRHNAFISNTAGSVALGPNCGTGVFISNGPANNTSISENSFTGHNTQQTAINFAGDPNPSNPSQGLSVTNNDSVDDSTFVVATNSEGAEISHNTISVPTPSADQGTAILDYGSNVDLSISDNQIDGGSRAGTSGINVRVLTGTPSVNTIVKNNKVDNRYNGIRLTGDSGANPPGATGATVSGNRITGSLNDGIFMQTGSNNVFLRNRVESSSVHDCQDLTSGGGTAGTANTWTGNTGKSSNSSPMAICPSR